MKQVLVRSAGVLPVAKAFNAGDFVYIVQAHHRFQRGVILSVGTWMVEIKIDSWNNATPGIIRVSQSTIHKNFTTARRAYLKKARKKLVRVVQTRAYLGSMLEEIDRNIKTAEMIVE